MYRFPGILLLAVSIVSLLSCSVYGSSQHMICKTVESVFVVEGPEQPSDEPRGLQGRAGKRGIKGERGFPGVVDNQSLEHVVEEKLAAVTKVLLDRIDGLEKKVEELNFTAAQTLHEDTAIKCDDGVFHNEKCYFAILHRTRDVTYDQRESICNDAGGTIAGIWNKQHQTLIENYVRAKLQNSDLPDGPDIWLSMTYDYSTKTLTMPNGNSFPSTTLRWHPGTPISASIYTSVMFYVREEVSSSSQGLYDYLSSYNAQGVLCVK